MVAEESAAKKTAASKKATTEAAAAGKAAGEEAPGKKAAARKATKKATKKAGAEAGAKKAPAKKAPAKKAAAKKAAARQTAADAAAGRRDGAQEASAGRAAQKTTGAKTVAAKKTPAAAQAEAVPSARNGGAAAPGELPVRPDEDPWTPAEVEEARSGLRDEVERLRAEIVTADEALSGLMRDSGDGAGDDDADTGTKNITREHEMALAANAREMLYQTERAMERLDAGTYGLCENCGRPIGKARMQAFPRATLCVECKQKQERR
ncbi:DNA-binding protein [Streptomyces albus subsp. chlorinus]|uniref:TraR/DksA family transcriptional regulator n=1 Tax=Streptomyces albus TaxID=1888 RepID=UPI00156E2FCE|nr:TraR/DksA C4-type zinc finger protein [Streptomyces albus]NSC21178.1 DNA-binding protein [Streptomyces albus subsp. chlorinus]